MIVFKITYDTSVVADFAPTFNNGWGYDYTTKTSTSGTLKTVTYESDTAFTAISIPNDNRNCVKSVYIDASGMTNLYGTFTSCQSMTDFTIVNATSKLTNLYQTTYDCTVLSNITYENCDLSSVTNIQNVFNNGARDVVTNATFKNVKFNDTTKSMISILGKATTMKIEDCDFSSITSCYNLFGGCVGLKGTFDLSMHDFTNVYETNFMFNECTNLTKIIMPKGTFDKITTCEGMFRDCTSLIEVDLSGFHIPNAQKMSYMFSGCVLIEEIDLSALGVLNPTTINHMFVSCQKLKRVNLSGIKIPKAMSFSHMFYDSAVIEWIDISNVITRASDATNFWKNGAVVNDIGMLYCPADVINAFARDMVSSGRTCNIYYHDAKLEDLTVDSRFNYIYCEEYHGDVVSTPDDLELHGLSDVQDTLDLTTGTYTQRVKKWNLAEEGYTLTSVNTGQEAKGYVSFYIRQPQFGGMGNPNCILNKATHINNLGLPNLTEGAWASYSGRCLGVAANNAFLMLKLKTTDVTSYDKAGLDEWVQANNFTIYYNAVFSSIDSSIKTETYQVDVSNSLKSYRNGSIITSSQQLTPTLKTTLPISNKFTQTNLSSGQTYNIYFDGTATKLDAGGTIITNPISPCEVECGGTTLTIEGIDIQNVRVLETTVKNEVGSVCGTTDVELNRVITSDLEVITNDIEFSSVGTDNGNINTVDNKLGTINTKGGHSWGAGYFTSNKTYPKGFSLLHIEFDVYMPSNNLMAIINFNNNVSNTYYNFRDLTLDNDTATIAQGQTSGIAVNYSSIVTKGHFSRLVYCFSSQGKINLNINTGSSAMITASGNNAEGSTSGYTACANNGITISNFKIKVIENYPDATVSSQVTSSLRTDSGLTVIWQDMDMSIGQSISYLEQPIKLRSLGTTYDSYNPVTGELTKRIGVSETDGSYSVLSSPVVENISMGKTIENIFNFEEEWINRGLNTSNAWQLTNDGDGIYTLKALQANATARVWFSLLDAEQTVGEELTTIMEVFKNTSNKSIPYWSQIRPEDGTGTDFTFNTGETGVKIQYGKFTATGRAIDFQNIGKDSEFQFRVTIVRGLYPNIKEGFGTSKIIQVPPHLYTNGQVKVYSESDVYPTTILNGQSTNNYEINELNTSNNYTIRYDGACESINLANKSNSQGTNRIVKAGATSGNLTFVNDSGDIDNVLLVQNDVREQEINHFNGLQTVEVSQLQISPSGVQNIFIQNTLNDFEKIGGYGHISEDGLLVMEHFSTNSDGVFRTKEVYTLEPNGKILIRLVETAFSAGNTYQLKAFIGDGSFTNGSPYYSNHTSLDSIAEEISKNGYCDLIFTNTNTTTSFTGQLTLGNYFNVWTISRVAIINPVEPIIIDLPQSVQLNSLPDGTCDTYNPITGEYVQNVGYLIYDDTTTWNSYAKDFYYTPRPSDFDAFSIFIPYHEKLESTVASELWAGNSGYAISSSVMMRVIGLQNKEEFLEYMKQYPLQMTYRREEPITTQLTPINIPTFEGGIVQLITTDGKVFPMVEYSMPTNNRYDTSSWEAGVVYTQRNMTEAYFNESTTPMIPTETMTLTTDHISSGSIILNDNGNGLIVLKGNYTGRDIPYFTGMRSVEAIEVETTPSPDQPLFGKGGRK